MWEADGVFLRRRRAAANGVGAPDERAVSGDSLRRRLHHAGAPPTTGCFSGCASCSGIPNGRAIPDYADDTVRVRNRARSRAPDRIGDDRAAARPLDGALRGQRPAVRADQQLRRRCSPTRTSRRGGMVVETDHPTLGAHPDAGVAAEDVRNAAASSGGARRCLASTRAKCFVKWDTKPTRFQRWASRPGNCEVSRPCRASQDEATTILSCFLGPHATTT